MLRYLLQCECAQEASALVLDLTKRGVQTCRRRPANAMLSQACLFAVEGRPYSVRSSEHLEHELLQGVVQHP